jgi:subtilisin family serine protease
VIFYTGVNPVKLIVKITETEPNIAFAEHDLNIKVKKYDLTLPPDPKYSRQWHLHTHTLPSLDYDPRSSARCEEAWQLMNNFGSANTVIGIADDGCKLDHQDFDSVNKFAAWGYFQGSRLVANNDIDALPAMMHEAGSNHGTSCAGVCAGEADGVLTVGAAPNCRLLPIKWQSEGDGLAISDSKLLTALRFISDKVDVFSNSWGGSPMMNFSNLVLTQIRELSQTGGRRGKGIVFLWAAGNENCPIDHTGTIRIPFDDGAKVVAGGLQWIGVSTSRIFAHNLTTIPGVMHIAALASNARRSHYSNYGKSISLCAPTNNAHEYHRLTVKGLGIVTTDGEGDFFTTGFGGTSSATPLVAGIAGLVISANPNLTALEVIKILEQTASKDLNFTPYPKTPPASFDPNPTWDVSPVSPHDNGQFNNINNPNGTWSSWFGFGKVDAFKAVEKALSLISVAQPTIFIRSALINPIGEDTNKETITLINKGAQDVSIAGWTLRNQANRKQILGGTIAANSPLTIQLISSNITLTNAGGTITLLDAQGVEINRVLYSRANVVVGIETVF